MVTHWSALEERTIVPGMHARFIHSSSMTFALWRMEAGAKLPRHSHPHEQVVHMRSGELELTVDGVATLMTAGDVLVIPPDVPHEGTALTNVEVLDAFSPVREDYRDGVPGILAAATKR